MRFIYFFFFLISLNSLHANSIKCKFEEVYQDGSIQSGQMFFDNGLLRYQYKDQQLFTIIFNKHYYVIRNDNRSIVNKLENDLVLNELKSIIKNYPKIENSYIKNDIKIKIYNSHKTSFIKRIAINSQKANLSIYFVDCKFDKIPKTYFQPFSVHEMNQ